jgi:uroporphyrinogen decarboxylase
MGNDDPVNVLARGDAASIRAACSALRAECGAFPNFVLSSGCDIPVAVPWENLETFFRVAQE